MYGPPDPYKRAPYGGGGYGGGYGRGYGYGGDFFNECCGPNLIPIVAGILLFIVYCLFIPGFAAPYWISYDTTSTEHYAGLWRYCEDLDTSGGDGATCVDTVDDDEFDTDVLAGDWLTATQALMCISLITLVIATLLFVYWICSWSRYFFIKAVFIVLFFLTFILMLVGVIIYGANATDDDSPYNFDWCFYLVVVATSILLFVPILLLCIPSRESFPSYGPRDRFGFEHPRGPPPAPMGPRPGYGRAEPVAHVYPNSLPRAKPYGGGSGYPGYPSMPYSSRY